MSNAKKMRIKAKELLKKANELEQKGILEVGKMVINQLKNNGVLKVEEIKEIAEKEGLI